MIYTSTPDNADIKFCPCQKKTCSLYKEWGAKYIKKKKKGFFTGNWEVYSSRWILFGVDGCENCCHFEKPDLYTEGD